MTQLPTGTVTFLFTDIEGSTPLWERMPAAMQVSIAQHHAILRRAIEANGGQVYQIVGDGFVAVFRLASQGLCAALAAQQSLQSVQWGATGPLRVRMGLHTGPAELNPNRDAVYAESPTLNRAARVMSAGHGGQVLLSQATKDLVERELPQEVSLRDLGEHRLKGLQWLEHLYQATAAGLPQEFPPLASSTQTPNNLPLQLSSFVGRQHEITRVKELAAASRLVSLTGAGGVGKTRLALRVAVELLEDFPKGVWLVELAPLGDPAMIAQVIANLFGLRTDKNRTPLEALLEYLRPTRVLLILDNCEHLIEGCAELADILLRACPEIHLLATSREALGLEGETVVYVPSLSVPDPSDLPALESLPGYEAIQLFCERAQAVAPGFTVTQANAADLARLCQRLDGIPLALELAAARLKILSLAQIVDRLDDRFRLLTGGSRRTLPRHQTLSALIDWSYGLLSASEQALFRCLSVFSGGWTLEAAEAVWGKDILDLLTRLVDKSLVQTVADDGGANRFRMLETIRQYAQIKLVEAGEAQAIRERHLDYYMAFAEACEPRLRSGERLAAHMELRADLANLRAALGWSFGEDDARHFTSQDAMLLEKGLRLAGALCFFWATDGHNREIIAWLEKALQQLDRVGICCPHLRVKADYTIGWLGILADEYGTIPYVQEGRALSQMIGDVFGYIFSTWELSILPYLVTYNKFKFNDAQLKDFMDLAGQTGDRYLLFYAWGVHSNQGQHSPEGYIQDVEACVQQLRELGNYWEACYWRRFVGTTYFELGQYDRARVIFEEALKTQLEIQNISGIAEAYTDLASIAMTQKDYPTVERLCQTASDYIIKFGDSGETARNLHFLAHSVLMQGDAQRAVKYFKAHCSIIIEKDFWFSHAHLVWDWARLAVAMEQPVLAARCLGGLTASIVDIKKDFTGDSYLEYERGLAFCRAHLDEKDFESAWNAGSVMSLDQILDEMETWAEGIQ